MHAFIKSSFWSHRHVENMPPEQKLALVWLLTNPGRDSCGFTTITPRRFMFDTGLPIEVLDAACAACCGAVTVLPEHTYFVRGFIRHQFCRGDAFSLRNNVFRAVVKQACKLPPALREAFFTEYPELAPPPADEDAAGGDASRSPSEALPPECEALPQENKPLREGKGRGTGNGTGMGDGNGSGSGDENGDGAEEAVRLRSAPPPAGQAHAVEDGQDTTMGMVDDGPPPDAAGIAALYPRRQSVREAVRHISRHLADGVDARVMAAGTREIAKVIRELPGGHLNAYVPSAEKFFANRRWEDDPRTWLRQAPARGKRGGGGGHGGPLPDLSLGGRTGTTVRIPG